MHSNKIFALYDDLYIYRIVHHMKTYNQKFNANWDTDMGAYNDTMQSTATDAALLASFVQVC